MIFEGGAKINKDLPVVFGCVCTVSNTKPVGGGRLSHAAVQQHRHRQHSDITNVTSVNEQLMSLGGKSFPVLDSLLCSNEWTDNIYIQIIGNTRLPKNYRISNSYSTRFLKGRPKRKEEPIWTCTGDRQGRICNGWGSERPGVVYDYARSRFELALDFVEDGS